jgi:SAM-dependent methyltransferase
MVARGVHAGGVTSAGDAYAGAAHRWATGASLVYGPIAEELVDRAPADWAGWRGRRVLDLGAGTGLVSRSLTLRGARPVAADLSWTMLTWQRRARPPAAVADVRSLPLACGAVDATVAAFVLNHLVDPTPAFDEVVRVTAPGGAVLACVYGTANRHDARDRIDATATRHGWRAPAWYVEMKQRAVPVLGDASAMAAAARSAGLCGVRVDETPVAVGVDEPEQLVDYRLGQAHFTDWLDTLGSSRAAAVRDACVAAASPVMSPYRPTVVFLSARTREG